MRSALVRSACSLARLRSALAIADDRLVTLGDAELLYGRLPLRNRKARRRRSQAALAVPQVSL